MEERAKTPSVPEGYTAADGQRQFGSYARDGDERCEFEIDRSRVLHSASFRRLSGKTQVFTVGQSDFFRTRLTHSLEVAQIAKGIALRVGAYPALCEAAGLAHDIGHPPFGHKGEKVLHALMAEYGGFEANAQNFRILTQYETKDNEHEGLDLTRATLDALFKYKTAYEPRARKFYYSDDGDLAVWIGLNNGETSFECQIMDWADDIAYAVHDLEDGVHVGLVTTERAAARQAVILDEVNQNGIQVGESEFQWVVEQINTMERGSRGTRKAVTSRLIGECIQGASPQGRSAQAEGRRYDSKLVISDQSKSRVGLLKATTFKLLIDDHRVQTLEARAERILTELFDFFRKQDSAASYPEDFQTAFRLASDDTQRARVAVDFIAGMTDPYAERMHQRLFGSERVALLDY